MWRDYIIQITLKTLAYFKKNQVFITTLLVTTICTLTFYFLNERVLYGQINDAMVELMQAYHLKKGEIPFFAPNYPYGNVMPIEGLIPILNNFIWNTFGIKNLEKVTYLIFYAMFLATLLIFAISLNLSRNDFFVKNNYQKKIIIVLALTAMASTSAIGHIVTILTRNGVSLFWSALAVLGMVLMIKSDQDKKKQIRSYICFIISFVGGIWTYSAFKPFFISVFTAWFVFNFLNRENLKSYFKLSMMMFLCGLCYYLILQLTQTPMGSGFFRGDYVVGDLNITTYFKRYIYTVMMPIISSKDQSFFFTEVVHASFLKPLLSGAFGVLFIIGTITCLLFFKKDIFSFSLVAWYVGSMYYAFAGPSLKYNYAMLLFPILISLRGLESIFVFYNHIVDKMMRGEQFVKIAGTLVLTIIIGQKHIKEEWNHLFNSIHQKNEYIRDTNYGYSAFEAIKSQNIDSNIPIYLVSSVSVDTARFLLKEEKTVAVTTYAHAYSHKWYFLDVLNNRFPAAEKVQVVCQDQPCPFLRVGGYRCERTYENKIFNIDHYFYQCELSPKYDYKSAKTNV
jgi:hypothetical protein